MYMYICIHMYIITSLITNKKKKKEKEKPTVLTALFWMDISSGSGAINSRSADITDISLYTHTANVQNEVYIRTYVCT